MKLRSFSPILSSVLALVLVTAAVNVTAEEPRAETALNGNVVQKFGNAAIKGTWGFSFDGTIFLPDSSGQSIPVPVSAVGWLRADGRGNFPETVRTLNLGGQVFHQTARGTYQINPDGTGTSDFEVFDRDTGVLVSQESFEFVVTADRNELLAIATAARNFVLAPGGVDLPAVTRISVRRQRSRD